MRLWCRLSQAILLLLLLGLGIWLIILADDKMVEKSPTDLGYIEGVTWAISRDQNILNILAKINAPFNQKCKKYNKMHKNIIIFKFYKEEAT